MQVQKETVEGISNLTAGLDFDRQDPLICPLSTWPIHPCFIMKCLGFENDLDPVAAEEREITLDSQPNPPPPFKILIDAGKDTATNEICFSNSFNNRFSEWHTVSDVSNATVTYISQVLKM